MASSIESGSVNALRLQYAEELVTDRTARRIAKSRGKKAPEDPPRLDATSQKVFNPASGFADSLSRDKAQLQIIREAIAERLLRLIDTLALNAATRDRSCHEVPILEPFGNHESRFTEEVILGLAERLGLDAAERAGSSLGSLANDLFEWAATNPTKADEVMQLVVDVPRRTVKVKCPELKLVRGERTARR